MGSRAAKKNGSRCIVWDEDFHGRYALGVQVMPTTNPDMEVCHAMRRSDGKRVVIKVRGKTGSFCTADEQKEWRATTEYMLNLPKSGGIAELYEVAEDAQKYYVVMEKVEGMDLFETLEQTGGLPLPECKEIIRQLLSAVSDLHTKGFIHKDLKLENVMIDRAESAMSTRAPSECDVTPKLKIIDFDTVEEWSPADRTRSKVVVGTDQYISQEAYAGNYSPASDIFAVGVIAYRLLTGRFPFKRNMFDDEEGENWVGSPKMKLIQDRLKHFNINYAVKPLPQAPAAREFCQALLAIEERDRPSAMEAMQHAFLAPSTPPMSLRTTASSAGLGPP
jgi:serine/threonine protein kinase